MAKYLQFRSESAQSRYNIAMNTTKKPIQPLTNEECLALLAATSKRGPCGARDRATIILLWRAQLRVAEALTVIPDDVDLAAGTVRIQHGKGDKSRVVGIDSAACDVLRRWIERRARLPVGPDSPLICTLRGGKLWPQHVGRTLRRLASKASITKRVHPHGLRHTGAFEMLSEGIRLDLIQRQLGHSSLAVTDRYLRHASAADVVDAMRGREW